MHPADQIKRNCWQDDLDQSSPQVTEAKGICIKEMLSIRRILKAPKTPDGKMTLEGVRSKAL